MAVRSKNFVIIIQKIIFIVLISILVFSPFITSFAASNNFQLTTKPEIQKPNRFAVIIGISVYLYSDENIGNLPFADKDAIDFKNKLIELGWDENYIRCIVNKEATKRNIEIALESWLTKAKPFDLILLYWSGHGFPDPSDPEKNYFVCYDTDPKIPATGYRVDRVRMNLEERKTKNVILIADTCHAGKLITRGAGGSKAIALASGVEKMRRENDIPDGWIFMVNSNTDREATEYSSLTNGAFTHCLLNALSGEADGYESVGAKDGVVTMGETKAYLYSKMPKETLRMLGASLHPVIATSSGNPDVWNLNLQNNERPGGRFISKNNEPIEPHEILKPKILKPITMKPIESQPIEPHEILILSQNENSEPSSSHEVIDQQLKKMDWSNIAFNTPKKLHYKNPKVINLVMNSSLNVNELKQLIGNAGPVESERIKISECMQAKLNGTNFIINSITPDIQPVSRKETTEWKWEVIPTKHGLQHLYLVINAVVHVDGNEYPRTVKTFSRDIEIYVTGVDYAFIFIGENWEWLILFLCISSGVYFGGIRLLRKFNILPYDYLNSQTFDSKESIDAFISYRREGGAETARLISKELRDRGVRVFLDVDDLASGHFDERLLREIEAVPNFIVILTPGCLTRCNTEGDWLRREIEHAIKTERNIIPILKDEFYFPPSFELPPSMAELDKNNWVRYDHVLFSATMERLVSFLKK